jgi:hypothetical protein
MEVRTHLAAREHHREVDLGLERAGAVETSGIERFEAGIGDELLAERARVAVGRKDAAWPHALGRDPVVQKVKLVWC